MKAFDTDILTEILAGNPAYAERIANVTLDEQSETLLNEWRRKKIRGSTHDLRMAASCVVSSATLVTRNRRDFEHIPGRSVEFWE